MFNKSFMESRSVGMNASSPFVLKSTSVEYVVKTQQAYHRNW